MLIKGNEEGKLVQDFLMLPQGFERYYSQLSRVRWRNLMCVECLQMIKHMVVGFCSTGGG